VAVASAFGGQRRDVGAGLRVGDGDHRGLFQPRHGGQYALDLGRFDAVTGAFQHQVQTTMVMMCAVGSTTAPIAGRIPAVGIDGRCGPALLSIARQQARAFDP
jgi:hypothetical protein